MVGDVGAACATCWVLGVAVRAEDGGVGVAGCCVVAGVDGSDVAASASVVGGGIGKSFVAVGNSSENISSV